MKLHFLGGILGAIGGAIGKTAGAAAKGVAGAVKGAAGAGKGAAKTAAKPAVKLGQGAKAITSPARDALAKQASNVGKKGSSKGGASARLEALSKNRKSGDTDTDADKPKTFTEKYGPAPPLPTFTPDYGVQAQPSMPQGRSAPLQLRGMAPVGGNPLHYHTHKAGEKVPKSSTPKMGVIGSGKRSSKSTCHYRSK